MEKLFINVENLPLFHSTKQFMHLAVKRRVRRQLLFHRVDGIDDRGMIPTEYPSNGGKRAIGQLLNHVNRYVTGRSNVAGALAAFEIFNRQAVMSGYGGEDLVNGHGNRLRAHNLIGDRPYRKIQRNRRSGQHTLGTDALHSTLKLTDVAVQIFGDIFHYLVGKADTEVFAPSF